MVPSHPQHPHHGQWLQQQAKAKKLVNLSTILGWGGVGFLLVRGPGLAMAVHVGLGGVLMGSASSPRSPARSSVRSDERCRVA